MKDHPRVCGEKSVSRSRSSARRGSPPCVRGEGCATRLPCALWRITPACAGRRHRFSARYAARRDHPRVCGEKHGGNSATQRAPGSPPRVRGEDSEVDLMCEQMGITPACAGRRSGAGCLRRKTPDHPRVCGEKRPLLTSPRFLAGSPPRVRGEG